MKQCRNGCVSNGCGANATCDVANGICYCNPGFYSNSGSGKDCVQQTIPCKLNVDVIIFYLMIIILLPLTFLACAGVFCFVGDPEDFNYTGIYAFIVT